jgi:ABC-type amino acid transport substrate-binding protein
MNRLRLFASLLGSLVLTSPVAKAAEPLRICLDSNAPPFSFKRASRIGGFDLALTQAFAERLGRGLSVQWFEAEDQPEKGKDTKTGVAALLTDKRCDLAGAYPLFTDSLSGSLSQEARLPNYQGRTRQDRLRAIALSELMASRPYIYSAPTVVLSAKAADMTVDSLADLNGVRIGAEQSSLSDIILMLYQGGRLSRQVTHIVPGSGLLERLEAGEYDAVLVDIHRFDGYRVDHPETALKLTGFLHPIGFNLGFVGLAGNADLISAVSGAIGDLLASGAMEELAKKAGLTYLAPREPAIRPSPLIADLVKMKG